MKIKAVKGVKDILPNDIWIWHLIEKKAKALCCQYGYHEIRTPILEEAHLFTRSIGKGCDIVRKEMYTFLDRKQRLLCLRPEATASVIRAYLEHNLDKSLSLAKFYYFGPMFRAEKPQAGRLRQFHHIGVEAVGSPSPYLDAEVISLALNIFQEIGAKDFTLQLNTIGCRKDRQKYKLTLKQALKNKLNRLCPDCLTRCRLNMLRVFDCKNETCQRITRKTPAIIDCLCPECIAHFQKVKEILTSLNIPYILNSYLVRGLDYYTKTCFEITHPDLGAQNAIGAGGRYDNLVSDLGGPQKPAIGFGLGVERLIAALGHLKAKEVHTNISSVYIAVVGDRPKQLAFKLLNLLRKQGICSEMDYQGKSLKAQMRQADRLGFKYVAILGEEELAKQVIILRDMQDQSQEEVKVDALVKRLKLNPENSP